MSTARQLAPEAPVIHIVDDDPSSGTATARVLRATGYGVRLYASAPEYLAAPSTGHGCLLLDLSLPGPDGLELQARLAVAEDALPVVFLSGHGDVPKTARAMKAGAVDFLTKPVEAQVLLEAVARAIARDKVNRADVARKRAVRARYERLTPREREVLAHVISGQLNKQIAADLGTSEHTVKVHRQRVMEKLQADSVPDLVRFAEDLGVAPAGSVR